MGRMGKPNRRPDHAPAATTTCWHAITRPSSVTTWLGATSVADTGSVGTRFSNSATTRRGFT